MPDTLPDGFKPFALVTSPDGSHWAAAGTFDDDDGGDTEAVVVDGVAGQRFCDVGRPQFTTMGAVHSWQDSNDGVGVMSPRGLLGPYPSGSITNLKTNGAHFAYTHRHTAKGKTMATVFIDGDDVGTFRDVGLALPHPDGGFCIQVDLVGRKEAKGLDDTQAIFRDGAIVANGPGLQYAVATRSGFVYVESAGKGFRLCRDGTVVADHEWLAPPAAHPLSGATAWAGRDNGRWKLYAAGAAYGDYDDVKQIQVALDGSIAAIVLKRGQWFAATAQAEHGPWPSLSTVSAGPQHRIAFVARADDGLVVGVDDETTTVRSAGTVAFCDDGAIAYAIAREEGAWSLVHAGGEVGPFALLSNPVRVGDRFVADGDRFVAHGDRFVAHGDRFVAHGDRFVAHGLRDGVVVRVEVPVR